MTEEAGRSDAVPVFRVLIVDDERDIADTQALLLRLCGQSVQQAYDARSALRIASEFKPEVVFIDLVMPDMNGFALAQRLRRVEGMDGAKFVAITALTQSAFREAAQAAGFAGYIQKPASAGDIINALVKAQSGIQGGDNPGERSNN